MRLTFFAVQGEVAGHLQGVRVVHLDRGALEGHGRILFAVEELGAAQMIVALLDAGVDALGLDRQIEPGLAGIGLVDAEVPARIR